MLKDITALKSTDNPVEAISKVAYPGQPEHLKMYKTGFEKHFNELPAFESVENSSDELDFKLNITRRVMTNLANDLKNDSLSTQFPEEGKFERTIIALEEPKKQSDCTYQAGKQLIVAHWGKDFESPVHGHSAGYMHEEVLQGKIRLNTFKIVDEDNRIAIPYKTEIITPGDAFISAYVPEKIQDKGKRNLLVHSFNVVEPSTSLHYLPEYNRDGRDNTYKVKHFSDENTLTVDDVTRITSQDGMYLQPGEVVLVRSTNVPEYADHFIVILGPPVKKEHGLRVQDWSIMASSQDTQLLDSVPMKMGLTLLKLTPEARDKFLAFHGITVQNKVVQFPNQD